MCITTVSDVDFLENSFTVLATVRPNVRLLARAHNTFLPEPLPSPPPPSTPAPALPPATATPALPTSLPSALSSSAAATWGGSTPSRRLLGPSRSRAPSLRLSPTLSTATSGAPHAMMRSRASTLSSRRGSLSKRYLPAARQSRGSGCLSSSTVRWLCRQVQGTLGCLWLQPSCWRRLHRHLQQNSSF